MTLRALLAICGVFTFAPALGFLMLFQPPSGSLWSRAKRRESNGAWWIGATLRLLAIAVASAGFRLMVVNVINDDVPLFYRGWFDKVTTLATVILGAITSVLFLAVYLAFRAWPGEDNDYE